MRKCFSLKQLALCTIVILSCLFMLNNVNIYAKKPKVRLSATKIYVGEYQDYRKLKLKGTKKKPKWSSSKKSVATVNKKGWIYTKKKGTTIITAKLGKKKYKCKVIVEHPYLNYQKLDLYVGDTKQLSIRGTKRKVTSWGTSDKGTASVTSKGVVKGVSQERVNVWANIGSESYFCEILVHKPEISEKQITIGTSFNQSKLLYIDDFRETVDNKKIKWYSDNEQIAIMNEDGRVIGIKPGKTTVHGIYRNKTYSCIVTVDLLPNYKELKLLIKGYGVKKGDYYYYRDSKPNYTGSNLTNNIQAVCNDNNDEIVITSTLQFASWKRESYTMSLEPNNTKTIVIYKFMADGNRELTASSEFDRNTFKRRSSKIHFTILEQKNLKIQEDDLQDDANYYLDDAFITFDAFFLQDGMQISRLGIN